MGAFDVRKVVFNGLIKHSQHATWFFCKSTVYLYAYPDSNDYLIEWRGTEKDITGTPQSYCSRIIQNAIPMLRNEA